MAGQGWKVGDRVICNPAEVSARYCGVVYTVTSIARVNVVLTPEGGGRGVRIHPSVLLPAPAAAHAAVGARVAGMVDIPEPLSAGAVVTVASVRWKGDDGPYVVLRDDGDRTQVAPLGGDGNRYWRIPRVWITPLDRGTVRDAVAAISSGQRN